jgi:hypothetical protein
MPETNEPAAAMTDTNDTTAAMSGSNVMSTPMPATAPASTEDTLMPAATPASTEDTPEQAAAKAALLQKMSDLDAQAATNAAVVAASDTNAVMDTNAPPSSVITGAPVSTPNSAAETSPPEQSAMPPASPPPAEITNTPMPPQSSSDEAAQAALNASQTNIVIVNGSTAVPPTPTVSQPATQPTTPEAKSSPSTVPDVNDVTAKELGLAPIQAPPPPVTAQQQQELQALLQRYEADQITPEEYQAERAKIMAGQ